MRNKCILPAANSPYLKIGGIAGEPAGDDGGGQWPPNRATLNCLTGQKGGAEMTAFEAGMALGNNTVYVPGGKAMVSCGSKTLDSGAYTRTHCT
jgi:hypothetical protein